MLFAPHAAAPPRGRSRGCGRPTWRARQPTWRLTVVTPVSGHGANRSSMRCKSTGVQRGKAGRLSVGYDWQRRAGRARFARSEAPWNDGTGGAQHAAAGPRERVCGGGRAFRAYAGKRKERALGPQQARQSAAHHPVAGPREHADDGRGALLAEGLVLCAAGGRDDAVHAGAPRSAQADLRGVYCSIGVVSVCGGGEVEGQPMPAQPLRLVGGGPAGLQQFGTRGSRHAVASLAPAWAARPATAATW